jgi:NADP-dependent 3-hydroxy acid dehydrogenase YdfG
MNKFFRTNLLPILSVAILTACGNLSKEVENKLNDLKNKTESLDSVINKEVDKVLALDSLINSENDKVKKLDSLINNAASKLDSISRGKVNRLKKIIE